MYVFILQVNIINCNSIDDLQTSVVFLAQSLSVCFLYQDHTLGKIYNH